MKKISILCAGLLSTAVLYAAEPADTLSVTSTQATIVETPNGVTVTLKGNAKDPDYIYTYHADYPDGTSVETNKEESDFNIDFLPVAKNKEYERKEHKGNLDLTMQGIMLGFAGGLNIPAGAKVDMGRSLDADFLQIIGLQYDFGRMRPKVSLGFGLGLNVLQGKNGPMYIQMPDGALGAGEFPEESYDRMSTMNDFKLHFPLVIKQTIGGNWRYLLGASLDVRTYCHVGNSYKIGDEKFSYEWSGVPMRKIGCSLIGALGNDGIGLYCKWQPKGMIKKGCGPDFGIISVGLIVGF